MSDSVIRVENLSKKYTIGHQKQERYTALRDVLSDKVKGLGNFFNRHAKNQDEAFEDFWALKDVSFEIKQGDRVGIIGRNGAGKSTLLKILSRITEPTSGKISIKGRVASLLEVGTGFHPELTGRENIYLNGAILGMDRFEIKKKFDEIVAFAEVEKFLDTPVKRYSSGMYVRLAFAVAAHLEPEILIVDEVLAVGDAQFQKKCLGKMEDVSKQGRTILFVSHNMTALQSLCKHGVHLSKGVIIGCGSMQEQIKFYLDSYNNNNYNYINSNNSLKIGGGIILKQFTVNPNPIYSRGSLEFVLELCSPEPAYLDEIAILIYSSLGIRVAILDLRKYISCSRYRLNGVNSSMIKVEVKSLILVEGDYKVGLWLNGDKITKEILDIVNFTVINSGTDNKDCFVPYENIYRGFVDLDFNFDSQYL